MTEFTTVPEHASPLVSARSRAASRTSRSRSPRLARLRAHRAPLSGPAAILAAAALWGTTGTASTLAPAGAPPAAVGSAGWRGAAVALHLAACTTFLAYRLFGRGLRSTPAQVATTLTLAEPAVATLLAVAVLGERLPALSWCGLGVLAAGLACLTVPASRRQRPGAENARTMPGSAR